MFGNLYRRILSWRKYSKYRLISIVLFVVTIGTTVALYARDYKEAKEEVISIDRREHGEGSIEEELEIRIEGEELKEKIEIEITERQYTDEELQKVFERSVRKLEECVLGENKSLDRVKKNINLVRAIPDEPVLVEWEIDRYDIINTFGEILAENVPEEGALVELKAHLRYVGNEEKQMLHSMHLYVCLQEEQSSIKDKLTSQLRHVDETSATEAKVMLPDEIEGQKILYNRPMNNRSMLVLGIGVTISFLVFCLEIQESKEHEAKKEEQMMRDYSEIIRKLNLFLGAGITVKSAWKKIIDDYEKQKSIYGARYAYEEMANTYREMQSGVLEAECYEHFGRNCKLKAYRKLGALLSQNLRKGTRGITELLSIEAIQAYEERKMRAKRQGEEAGTKLLLPMFLMLAVVLIIVIVPAFLAIQI